MKRATRLPKTAHSNTFDVDIAQEFKDIKTSLQELAGEVRQSIQTTKDEFREWQVTFNTQLTQLNDNMRSVLEKISDHEQRLTLLETKNTQFETRAQTVGELAKFGWFIAKASATVTLILVGALGAGKVWQMMFPA